MQRLTSVTSTFSETAILINDWFFYEDITHIFTEDGTLFSFFNFQYNGSCHSFGFYLLFIICIQYKNLLTTLKLNTVHHNFSLITREHQQKFVHEVSG